MTASSFRTITQADYRLDGGTITLWLLDAQGIEHELLLARHMMPEPDRLTGRLYLDDRLIEVRSPEEAAILAFLEFAPTSAPERSERKPMQMACAGYDLEAYFAAAKQGPATAVRHLAKQLVAFVRSGKYVYEA
jgi:hypothetical protein